MGAPLVIASELTRFAVPVEGLTEDPENARAHNAESVAAIVASFRQFGQQKPIVMDPAGRVLAGNGVLRAARKEGWERLAAVTFRGTADEARAFAVADNRTSELSRWDDVAIAQQMVALVDADPVMAAACGFTEREVQTFRTALEALDASAEPKAIIMRVEFATAEDEAAVLGWLDELAVAFPGYDVAGSRLAAFVQTL